MLVEEEEDDVAADAAAAIPSVWVLLLLLLPVFASAAICIEFPYQLNTILKTTTADSMEADTTRACSVVFFIVIFNAVTYYCIVVKYHIWVPDVELTYLHFFCKYCEFYYY